MSRTTSALKAARTSVKRRAINHRRIVKLETLERAWRKAATPSADVGRQLQQAIDKAAGRNVLHPRTAARLKSRLMKAQTPASAAKKAAPKKAKK